MPRSVLISAQHPKIQAVCNLILNIRLFQRPSIGVFVASLLAIIPTGPVTADTRPNFILIVADDLGYGDLTSYGGNIATPNIDALAEQGVRFTDFHSNAPVCTPTRAAMLTGRYPERAQLTNALGVSSTIGLHPDQITIADLLKPAGYQTAIVGKWHLGRIDKFKPAKQGFNFFFGFLNGEIDYVNHLDSLGKPDWWKNSVAITKQGVLGDSDN
ncbi:MAG: sulfatase-like hydrolase/transferase [Rhodospirillales bacterium]|nr:sulfatase-like hydrolase/transferase [Rhodospirillales bacterium]